MLRKWTNKVRLQQAESAIDQVWADDTVSKQRTLDNLDTLIAHCQQLQANVRGEETNPRPILLASE